jgi:hypothetical protein
MATNVLAFRQPQSRPPTTTRDDNEDEGPRKPVSSLRKQFTNAIANKSAENREAAEAERYFHGVQWDQKEAKTLDDRGQPIITFNRIKRKVNTICGILERMKQDPKAFPRSPQKTAEDGAELCTKVLRYALGWDWDSKSIQIARRVAVRGISGVECVMVQGDQGDPEIEWDEVDQRDFFYDPRSVKADFSDARFMGTTRWMDIEEAKDTWPDYEEEIQGYVDHGPVSDEERGDERSKLSWLNRTEKQVRIVDHWYVVNKTWYYTIYCGNTELEYGESPYKDVRKQSTHKFEMFSNETDQDGDRYSFVRDWKSAQDEINQRRSKALHNANSRRVIADSGAVDDVEVARREMARADGWVVKNPGKELLPEDAKNDAVYKANLEMLAEAKNEIDTYGPNPGLIGMDVDPSSGRAIALMQAAGIAELGDFMLGYRNWKLRVYRKTWMSVQTFWKAPRWIRVADDEQLNQFVQVNGWEKDPETGRPIVINQLASLDVDIMIDESQDTITTMADTFDMLLALAKAGTQVPPEMIIEMSNLPSSSKQKIMQKMGQQDPMQQKAIMLKLEDIMANIEETKSKTALNLAKAQEAQTQPPTQIDTPADMAKANLDTAKAAEIQHKIQVGTHVPQPKPQPTPQMVEPPEPGLFEVNRAKALRELAAAQTEEAKAAKLAREARTIDEAPPGMLQTPPPRPPVVSAAAGPAGGGAGGLI